jgi:uncharacterized protein
MKKTRIGDWIETYSGVRFYPLDPKPEEIDIGDIAHALSLTCRYNGHCKFFYSVGLHSIYVSKYLREMGYDYKIQLYGLLHDASEAYLSDITRPVKPYLKNYTFYEQQLMSVIYKAFNIPEPTENEYELIKYADDMLLYHEANILLNKGDWGRKDVYLNGFDIVFKPMKEVEEEYIQLFKELQTK